MIGRRLLALARAFALAGGAVLVALLVMAVASIVGRWLFAKPLPGDYELAQLAGAVAVAAFLPWCQMRGGHVRVDFFTTRASARTRGLLDALGSLLTTAVAALVTWRMGLGLVDLRAAGEQSMILGIPTWYAYAAMLPSFALFTLTAAYSTAVHLRGARP